MSDFGLGFALQGLYSGKSKSDRVKDELGTIGLMENQFVKENAEKEAAQIKQQVYDREVSEFANKLLGPDRDKINQKAKILQQRVRDEISVYGGDMSKFFANGGHAVMNDYKSAVVNSTESTTYLENQKNMQQLTAIQFSGKGALINSRDLQSMQEYNKNGGGKITYTGMLNEVKMPEASKYEYGTEIPSEDILNENMFAIKGNFVTEYGREPSDNLELINYTKLKYGSKGSNYQFGLAKTQEANRHQEAQLDAMNDQTKAYYDYMTDMAKINAKGGRQTIKTTDANGNEVEMFADQMPGYVAPNQQDQKGTAGYSESMAAETLRAVASMGEDIDSESFLTGKFMEGDGSELYKRNSIEAADGEFVADDLPTNEVNLLGLDIKGNKSKKGSLSYGFNSMFSNSFAPAKARKLFVGNEAEVAQIVLGANEKQVNLASKKILAFQPTDDMFLSNGVRISDNEDVVDTESYTGDYTVKGIITVGIGKDKEGRDSMVMDRYDGKKVHDKSHLENQEKYSGGTIRMKQAIVLEDAYGNRFYKPYENNTAMATKIRAGLKEKDNLAPVTQSIYTQQSNANVGKVNVENAKQSTKTFWETTGADKSATRAIQNQTVHFSANGQVDGRRDNLMKGYYAMIATGAGISSPDDFRDRVVNNPTQQFATVAREYMNEGFDVLSMSKDYSLSDEAIINKLIDWSAKNGQQENIPNLQSWLTQTKYLNQNR